MTTEHIEQIFTDYIKTDKTQYAVLLNGSWGCGKTYFWKYTLEDIAKKTDFKTIYVSLNGINKIEDLDRQLFTCDIRNRTDTNNRTLEQYKKIRQPLTNKTSSGTKCLR